jgi:hypothetical protein
MWGFLFGTIGFAFFTYGRKQRVPVPMVCGLLLMVFPYVVTNVYLMVVLGITLMVIPYFLRL